LIKKEKLKINQKVEIQIPDGSYKGSYSSRVEEIHPDGSIVLAAPFKRGVLIPLRKGDTVVVNFWGQTAGYSFTTTVLETNYQNVPMITVLAPSTLKKIQRRNFVRVAAWIPLAFSILKDTEDFAEKKIFRTETVDISGGGVLIKSPLKLSEGDRLEMEIQLPKRGPVSARGQVVRVEEKKEQPPVYLVGVAFTEITETDRTKIIRFVFERQREMRQKGLI
jgi:c-di-GMP-binding flagellar brake protein YcgR